MKMNSIIRKWSGIAALALLSAGCVDSDDPSFEASAMGYILQRGSSYAPYVAVTSNQVITSATVQTSAMPVMVSRVLSTNVWEVPEMYLNYTSSVPNGNYQCTVKKEKGEAASTTLTLNVTATPMGAIELSKFEIKDGVVSMAVSSKVENATTYYLMVAPGLKANENATPVFYRYNANFCLWNSSSDRMPASGELNLKDLMLTNFRYELKSDDVIYINFVAAKQETTGTVIREYLSTPVPVELADGDRDFLIRGPEAPGERQ